MNRASVLAMVAAIALTAGLVLVFGEATHYRPYRTVPMADAVEPDFGVPDDQVGLTGQDSSRSTQPSTDVSIEDFMEILGASMAISTTSTTVEATTSTTVPKGTPTTIRSSPTTTAPRSTTTTAGPTTTTAQQGSFRPDYEAEFLSLINSLRASNGLPPLAANSSLTTRARNWSRQMADNNKLGHSNLSSLLPQWSAAGENVGRGGTVQGLFDALADSSGHRSNMLGEFTHVGIGVWRAADGTLWTTHVFAR